MTWSNNFFTVDGLNKITTRVLDGADNVGISNSLQFTHDTQLLETSVRMTCDSGISGTDRISSLADKTLVRDWASSYLPPSSNGDYVVEVRTTDKAVNTWSVLKPTFSPVADGSYQVRQVASDAVGNTVPLVFTLDTT